MKTLERLKAIIDSADDLRRQRLWQRPNDDYRAALQPVGDAAGDFSKTLEECKTLLDNKSRFRADTANFVRNVQWSLVVERDVNTLRDRVRFHLIKVIYLWYRVYRVFDVDYLKARHTAETLRAVRFPATVFCTR